MNLSGKTNYAELLLNCSPNSEYSLICIFFFACFSTISGIQQKAIQACELREDK